MNKAITDGLVLMPPAFAAGLNLWSREDGLAGQGSWAGQPNAAFVPADQDFGGCLELQKTATLTKLRCFQQIPFLPGMYLRVTARVKCLSGNFPTVRIAGFAGATNGSNVTAAVQTGPQVTLGAYGTVYTVSAIVGSGSRTGVDMPWGTAPAWATFGIDLLGANGGLVRIDDIAVEDVTNVFLRDMITLVDVRDYGARGDGVTDDTAAFVAADAAAGGRTVLVPRGSYRIGSALTLNNPVRFEGTLTMPDAARLVLMRNFNIDGYAAAFGSEQAGLQRGLQALFAVNDHVSFDLLGQRVEVDRPLDLAALAGTASFSQRRVLTNGQIVAIDGPAWGTQSVTSTATYATTNPNRLTGVANVANIAVGARVTGTGVGREVYVTAKNVAAGTVDLSQPLFGAAGTRSFGFDRYAYQLDMSGFAYLARFEVVGVEWVGQGLASGVMLPVTGLTNRFADCVFNRPKDRAITSLGTGCQGMFVDSCQFLSNEIDVDAQNRTTIALNTNANDIKLRLNRVVRFAHFAVVAGTGSLFIGNHFFQGDATTQGTRRAGVVLTAANCKTLFTGNYVDNCFIEWTNEHDPLPDFSSELSFGGLTITGNIFMASDVGAWFRWLVVTPRGAGHFINGLSVSNNAFKVVNAGIDRVETVDTTTASLNPARMQNIQFEANAFHGVGQMTVNPLTIEHSQTTAADTWAVDGGAYLPFDCNARYVTSVVPKGAVTNATNVAQFVSCYTLAEQGADKKLVHLKWPSAVKGKALVTLRCDSPT